MWDNRGWIFSLEEALLWIMESYFGQKQQFKVKIPEVDGFVYYKRSFWLLKMLIDGLGWCGLLVMFLSAVWILILTAPINDIATSLQIHSDEETN